MLAMHMIDIFMFDFCRYQARIVNINTLNLKVLVHFEGWNSRHDKWFEHTNESLRPLLSGDQKQQEGYKRKVGFLSSTFNLICCSQRKNVLS